MVAPAMDDLLVPGSGLQFWGMAFLGLELQKEEPHGLSKACLFVGLFALRG